MRLSNRKKEPLYNFINTLVIFSFAMSILIFFADRFELHTLGWKASLFLLINIVAFGLHFIRRKQIFEYDSDGEALNFRNYSIIPFLGREARDEFPKYKLISFDITDAVLFKRLHIKITSRKKNEIVLKYDISYLTSSEIRDLKLSLQRTIKANKENSDNNDR